MFSQKQNVFKYKKSVYTCIVRKIKNYNLPDFHLYFQEKYETQHDFLLICVVLFMVVDLVNK